MSHRWSTAAAAALMVGALAPGAYADPEDSGREGLPCTFVVSPQLPARDHAYVTGELSGGPLLGNGTLACTVQLGDSWHSGPDAVVATASGTEAAYLTSRPVDAAGTGDVFVCTSWIPADGSPTLYYGRGDWTVDPESTCESQMRAGLPGFASASISAPGAPPRPVYPQATVTLTNTPGGFQSTMTAATPSHELWSCTRTAFTESCTPPPPEPGTYYVCATVTATVKNDSPGTVTGRSGCASGAAATATGRAFSSQVGTARPRSAFAWKCGAAPDVLAVALWTVQCTVGP